MTAKHWPIMAGLAALAVIGAALAFTVQDQRPGTPAPQQAAAAEEEPADVTLGRSYSMEGEEDRIYLSQSDMQKAAGKGLIPAGARSILSVEDQMRHGQFVWQDNGKMGPLTIWVDLDRQLVSAFRGGHEIGTSVILYGAEAHASPTGAFPVKAKYEDYHSRTYDAPMPYSLWLTDDGVALHGSDVRWGRATHGCIGVPVEFAQRLFAVAEEGDVVHIVRSSRMVEAGARKVEASS